MSGRILKVPYRSQNDIDATLKRNDCGPACIAMLLAATGQDVTTNTIAATGDIVGDNTLSLDQIVRVGQAFGLNVSHKSGVTLAELKHLIDNGQPPIALIKYDKILYRWNKQSIDKHFVIVVGYDDASERVIINDPDFPPGPMGYQRPYSYKVFTNAWGGFSPAEHPNFCLIAPGLAKPIGGIATSGLALQTPLVVSDDAWVTHPRGISLRAQASQSSEEIGYLVFGQHVITMGLESAPDTAGCTWQVVHTDSGITGLVCITAAGEQFVSKTQPAMPFVVQVLNTQAVREARGLSLRPKRDIFLLPIDRIQVGEQLVAYARVAEPDGTLWLSVHSSRARFGWVREQFNGTVLVKALEPKSTSPILPPPAVEAWPFGKCLSGVGMGNPQPLTPAQLGLIAKSKVEACKILTLPNPDDTLGLVQGLKSIPSIKLIIARLFFSADANSKSRFSPQVFVDTVLDGVQAAYQAGVRHFEVHNEPNLEGEGLGWNWSHGKEFGDWLIQVVAILRRRFPEIRLGFPGLSPQPNVLQFLEGATPAIEYCDWLGVHCYWQTTDQGPFTMTSAEAGMYWRNFRQRFPNKLLMITEFSNNNSRADPAEKGRQYARYYQLLRSEANIGAAFSFALAWPDQDANQEGWETDGRETAIPGTVGALLSEAGFLT